jgi:hypothetical protein
VRHAGECFEAQRFERSSVFYALAVSDASAKAAETKMKNNASAEI